MKAYHLVIEPSWPLKIQPRNYTHEPIKYRISTLLTAKPNQNAYIRKLQYISNTPLKSTPSAQNQIKHRLIPLMNKLRTQKAKKKKATPQSRFNDALARYHRLKKQQSNFRNELEQLVQRVRPQIEEHEVMRLEATKLLSAKLINFVSKKSISEYLREELFDWIESNLRLLSLNPFSDKIDIDDLLKAFSANIEALKGYKIEKQLKNILKNSQCETTTQEAEAALDELYKSESLEDFMKNCDTLFGETDELSDIPEDEADNQTQNQDKEEAFAPHTDDMFGFDGIPEEKLKQEESVFEDDDFFEEFENIPDPAAEQEAQLRKLLKKTSINKLFRRIAKTIHPDLEQDETKKKLRHTQMSELIEARDNKDIAKILDIYTDTFGALPDDFPESDYETLTKIININIEELKDRRTDALHENPYYSAYHEWFSAKSPKQEAVKIKKFCETLENDISSIMAKFRYITSIKTLKPLLEARYEANIFNDYL